jgi:hypothetical protein
VDVTNVCCAVMNVGLLYTISDVLELADWMIKHCTEHPLFERVPDSELVTALRLTLRL